MYKIASCWLRPRCWLVACAAAQAETVGSVDTVFKLIGPDHKIVVDAYDDPQASPA